MHGVSPGGVGSCIGSRKLELGSRRLSVQALNEVSRGDTVALGGECSISDSIVVRQSCFRPNNEEIHTLLEILLPIPGRTEIL